MLTPTEFPALAGSALQPLTAYPPLIPGGPASTRSTQPSTSRWSASAWLFLRDDFGAGLAPGGTLGGSQAGLRLAYRLNNDARRPLSLVGRAYMPVDRPRGSEVAVGLEWRPVASLPLNILVERRQRLGPEGRADFGISAYGGVQRDIGRFRIEAYGQAGIVGIEARDLFADGAARASMRAGRVEVGASAWGGAQPGASRLDVGPQVSVRIPVGRTAIRASADYRFRILGDAAPRSGPALTLATDF